MEATVAKLLTSTYSGVTAKLPEESIPRMRSTRPKPSRSAAGLGTTKWELCIMSRISVRSPEGMGMPSVRMGEGSAIG